MEHESPNRFDRIVAILIQLQSGRIVKARDMADRFQVSLRTIYRDIRSLHSAGVPVIGEAGTGYSLVEGYRLPPVMFSREEAGSFVAAEKLMAHFTDRNLGSHFESALFKIKSVLRNSEKDWIEALDAHITIHSAQKAFNENIPNALELLLQSVAEKKQVILDYKSRGHRESSQRQIEVVGLFHENRYWYIMGYCHLRKDYRQFRIDRIQGIAATDKNFRLTHESVDELRKKASRGKLTTVRLLVEPGVVSYMKYDRDAWGFTSEINTGSGNVEMEFQVHDIHTGFARWLMMFADFIHILEPESLKIRVREILNEAIKKQTK